MQKRLIAFGLTLIILISVLPVALAHPKQKEHDNELSEILFGDFYGSLSDEGKLKFQAIADAAALCIDQFSTNEEKRSKEPLFIDLNKRIGFSFSFDDIELQRGSDGKNVSAKTHRRYTHRGWDFQEYPLPELWLQRKKILTATVNKVVFGQSPGLLVKLPFLEGLVYNESACNPQCEAFCKLVYYVHIIGDYREAESYSPEFQQLIPLVRHEDPTSPAIIDELISIIPILFDTQPWTYPILVQDMEDIRAEAERILFVTGGIRTQEQFDEYQQCAENLFKKLSEQIPSLLRNADFFSEAFYQNRDEE